MHFVNLMLQKESGCPGSGGPGSGGPGGGGPGGGDADSTCFAFNI